MISVSGRGYGRQKRRMMTVDEWRPATQGRNVGFLLREGIAISDAERSKNRLRRHVLLSFYGLKTVVVEHSDPVQHN